MTRGSNKRRRAILRFVAWSAAAVTLAIAIAIVVPVLAYELRDRSKISPFDTVAHAQSLIDARITPGMSVHEAVSAVRDLGFDCSGERYELLPEFEKDPIPEGAVAGVGAIMHGRRWFAIVHPSMSVRVFLDESDKVVEARARVYYTGM
jgi:hypothetical protein